MSEITPHIPREPFRFSIELPWEKKPDSPMPQKEIQKLMVIQNNLVVDNHWDQLIDSCFQKKSLEYILSFLKRLRESQYTQSPSLNKSWYQFTYATLRFIEKNSPNDFLYQQEAYWSIRNQESPVRM